MHAESAPATGWSVAAAAERVGVSVSTLHTWERRYGLRPQGRTAGGHRRYTAADVALLQRLRRLVSSGVPTGAAAEAVRRPTAKHSAGPRRGSDDLDESIAQLCEATEDLDVPRAERLARLVLSKHGAVDAWTDVFTPVLQSVGQRWADTQAGVECEHAVTAALHTVLVEHTRRLRRPPRAAAQHVLLAATPTEEHTLPLEALAAALAERRIAALVLGTLPAEALRAAIERLRPAGLMLFSRSRDHEDTALLRKVATTTPLVCAAGPGWPARLPAPVATAHDLPAALDLVVAAVG